MSKRYKQHRRSVRNNPFQVKPGGYCPVQAEGTVGKFSYYFRSRGTGWSAELWKPAKVEGGVGKFIRKMDGLNRDERIAYEAELQERFKEQRESLKKFYYGERKLNWPDAGWLSNENAVELATEGLCRCFAQACAYYKISPLRLTLPRAIKARILSYML